jgi:hypothetical protein
LSCLKPDLRLSGLTDEKSTKTSSGSESNAQRILVSRSLAHENAFSQEKGNQSMITSLFSAKILLEVRVSAIVFLVFPSSDDMCVIFSTQYFSTKPFFHLKTSSLRRKLLFHVKRYIMLI